MRVHKTFRKVTLEPELGVFLRSSAEDDTRLILSLFRSTVLCALNVALFSRLTLPSCSMKNGGSVEGGGRRSGGKSGGQ